MRRAMCSVIVVAAACGAASGVHAEVTLSQREAARVALAQASTQLDPIRARVDEEDANGTLGRLLDNPEFRVGDFRSDRLINPLFDGSGYGRAVEDMEFGVRWAPPKIPAMGAEQRAQSLRVKARKTAIDAAERGVVREAFLLHAELRSLKRRLALANEQVDITVRIQDLLKRRLDAQLSTGLDESLSALDAFDAQADLRELELQYERTRLRFFALLGWLGEVEPAEVTYLAPDYGTCQESTDTPDQMAEKAIALSPQMSRYHLESEAFEAEKLTQYLRLVPWFSFVQAGVVPGSTEQAFSVRFQMGFELPVLNFRQNQLATLDARARNRKFRATSEEQRLNMVVLRAHRELSGQASLVRFYDEVTTPRLVVSEKQIEDALNEGTSDPIDMALLRARILRAKRTHLKAELSCERTQIELLLLTAPLAELVQGDRPAPHVTPVDTKAEAG